MRLFTASPSVVYFVQGALVRSFKLTGGRRTQSEFGERRTAIVRFGVDRETRRIGVHGLVRIETLSKKRTADTNHIIMGQFPNGTQERKCHLAGAVILQLLLMSIATVDDLEQKSIGGVLRSPAGLFGALENLG